MFVTQEDPQFAKIKLQRNGYENVVIFQIEPNNNSGELLDLKVCLSLIHREPNE